MEHNYRTPAAYQYQAAGSSGSRSSADCRLSDLLATDRLKSGRVLGGMDYSMVTLYSRNCVTPQRGSSSRQERRGRQLQREYQKLSEQLRESNSNQIHTAGTSLNSTGSSQTGAGNSYLSAARAVFKSPYHSHQTNCSGEYSLYGDLSRMETSESMRNQLHVQLSKLDGDGVRDGSSSVPKLRLSHGTARPLGVNLRKTHYLYKPRNLGYK